MTIARPTSVRDLLGAVSVVCFVYAMTSWIVLLPSLFYRFPCAISAIFSVLALGYLILWQVSSLFRFVVSIFVVRLRCRARARSFVRSFALTPASYSLASGLRCFDSWTSFEGRSSCRHDPYRTFGART